MGNRNQERKQIASKKMAAYGEFFRSEEGQTVLSDLMRSCFFRETTIASSPELTYYNEGKRNVVMQIIQTAKLKPEEIDRLINTMNEEDNIMFGDKHTEEQDEFI